MNRSTTPTAGDILSLDYLGHRTAKEKPFPKVAVFVVRYYSAADGGTKLAARLFVPAANPLVPPLAKGGPMVRAYNRGGGTFEFSRTIRCRERRTATKALADGH